MVRRNLVIEFAVVILILTAEATLGASAAEAQKLIVRRVPRSVPMQSTSNGQLSVTVVSLAANAPLMGTAGSTVMDIGTVSYAGSRNSNVSIERKKNSFVVTTAFGLAVTDATHQAHFATVSAFVSGQNPRLTYRIDGRRLESAPTVVVPQVAVGSTTRHRLEVEIPNSLTEQDANLQIALQFEVMPN